MRERVTYILQDSSKAEFDPTQLEITKTSLAVPGIDGVKEHQITLAYDEIPPELWRFLRNAHEFHLRWQTQRPFNLIAPYLSRIPPGLHVSFTPLPERTGKRLCPLLKESFGRNVKCESIDDAFTTPPILSGRFSSSASKQFFSFVPSIFDLSLWTQQKICGEEAYPCRLRAHDLKDADTLDLDYDAVSQTLTVKAIWSHSNADDKKWYETHMKGDKPGDTLEVGVLMNERPDEAEELRYSGFLTQVGKDTKASPTLFSFPSRFHPLPSNANLNFQTSFNQPTGLHPTLSIQFSDKPVPPESSCALHTYLTLPSTIFLDKYPFSDALFLENNNLKKLHAISGATDLEAPEWVTKAWGSAILFEVASPSEDTKITTSSPFKVTVPLHLRYLPPANSTHILLPVPWPAVFWSCPAESGSKFAAAPFDRTNLGYDGLFGTNTVFYPVLPAEGARQVETLMVPVMELKKAEAVEWGTIAVVAIGTLWVLLILWNGLTRFGYGRVRKTAKAE